MLGRVSLLVFEPFEVFLPEPRFGSFRAAGFSFWKSSRARDGSGAALDDGPEAVEPDLRPSGLALRWSKRFCSVSPHLSAASYLRPLFSTG